MFIISKKKGKRVNYIVDIINNEKDSFTVQLSNFIVNAKKYSLEECFEVFEKYPELQYDGYSCTEVPINEKFTHIY